MNKNVLIVIWLFMSLNAKAQIEMKENVKLIPIGTAKTMGVFRAQLDYTVNKEDTIYSIYYKNWKYTSLDDYQTLIFGGGSEVLNQLYDILKAALTDKSYEKHFTLGKEDVTVSNSKNMAMLWTDAGYFYLTAKELDKLFGK